MCKNKHIMNKKLRTTVMTGVKFTNVERKEEMKQN